MKTASKIGLSVIGLMGLLICWPTVLWVLAFCYGIGLGILNTLLGR